MMKNPVRDHKESSDQLNLQHSLMEEIDGQEFVLDASMLYSFESGATLLPIPLEDKSFHITRAGKKDPYGKTVPFLKSVFGCLAGLPRLPRFWLVAILALFLFGLIAETVEAATNEYPKLFGSRERRYKSLKPFTKWTGMLSRFQNNQPTDGSPCDPFFHRQCDLEKWSELIARLKGADKLEVITEVNKYQNNAKYLTDIVNWRQEDYWATIGEFFARNGDCEDYAIAKYLSLKRIGFKASDLRIVVVQDLNLNIGHAILVVYYEGRALILDNQVNEVLDSTRIRHYNIHYSINEKNWWRHKS